MIESKALMVSKMSKPLLFSRQVPFQSGEDLNKSKAKFYSSMMAAGRYLQLRQTGAQDRTLTRALPFQMG